jgi:parallel beta-helix repeat protein
VTVSCGPTPYYPPGATGTRYVYTGWTGGTGDILATGSDTSYTFTITQDSTITWTWQTQYQLTTTASPSAGGSITRSPDATWYDSGSVVQLTAAANTGYVFTAWSGDLTGTTNPQDLTMNGPKSVTATFAFLWSLTVASVYGEPDPPEGTTTYPDGSSVIVDCGTTPYYGTSGTKYVCTGWTGGSGDIPAAGVQASYTFTITQNCTITWVWKTQYQLTTTVSPSGGGTITCDPVGDDDPWYDADIVVTVTAVPNPGWVFYTGWSGDLTGTTNPQSLTMSGPKSVTAHFTPLRSFTVVSAQGEPDPAVGTYQHLEGATVDANCGTTPYPPDASGTRYVCTGHSGTGNVTDGSQTSISFTITVDSSVTWLWQTRYQLTTTASPSAGGNITRSPDATWYNSDAVVTLTAVAKAGYVFANWSGDLTGTTNPQSLTMSGPKNVTANFAATVPVADFTGAPTSGNVPLSVLFTDASAGNITSWSWNFGSGASPATANGQGSHPVIYTTEGWKTVSLIATGPAGSNTKTRTDYIYVLPPAAPVIAGFSGSPRSAVDPPLTVQFTDESTGNITSWEWDFNNDGTPDSTAQNPAWEYSSAGRYTVKLTVSGPDGSDDETKIEYIRICVGKIYVRTGGLESNDGSTWTLAKKTIQAGITAATADNAVLVAKGTYNIAGDYNIDFAGKVIHLKGVTAGATYDSGTDWIIDGSNVTGRRGFAFMTSETAHSVVDNFTIQKCIAPSADDGGGIYCYGASPIIINCRIKTSRGDNGGGIFCEAGSNATITGCTLTSNQATSGDGGGIYCINSSPRISGCAIGASGSANMATGNGGGIYLYNSNARITNCTVEGNSVSWWGGGIYCEGSSPLISGCTINDNVASDQGGGIYLATGSNATITNCPIYGNSATYYGGGIYCETSTPTISGCTIGADGFNQAGDSGGGICLYTASPNITKCVITNNTAVIVGGAIECWNECSPAITNCLIASNSATATSAGNGNGGGIDCYGTSNPTITNCTIADNTATNDGGGISCYISAPVLNNTILWGNIADSDTSGAGLGNQIYTWRSTGTPSMVTLNYCDYGDNTVNSNNIKGNGTVTPNNCIVSDPLFADAPSYDYHLQATSPCIDTGSNALVPSGITTDLEGLVRIYNVTVDRGAYEYQP